MKDQPQLPHDIVELPLYPFIPDPIVWQILLALLVAVALCSLYYFKFKKPFNKRNFSESLLLQLEALLKQAHLKKFELDQIALLLRRLISNLSGTNCMGANLHSLQPVRELHRNLRDSILRLDGLRYQAVIPDTETIRRELLEVLRNIREEQYGR